jgi:hypothetical protein
LFSFRIRPGHNTAVTVVAEEDPTVEVVEAFTAAEVEEVSTAAVVAVFTVAVAADSATVAVVAIVGEMPTEVRDPSVEEVPTEAEAFVADHPTGPAEVPTADSADHAG